MKFSQKIACALKMRTINQNPALFGSDRCLPANVSKLEGPEWVESCPLPSGGRNGWKADIKRPPSFGERLPNQHGTDSLLSPIRPVARSRHGTDGAQWRYSRVRIATYNVNGINGRLPVVLEWLAQTKPDVVCLQELKAANEKFPESALDAAGYGAIWHGQKSWNGVAILARGRKPEETRRGLPNGPDETQSRYLEAAVGGVLIGCLYVPNGNPRPGPKFDYKLAWLDRFQRHAAELIGVDAPVILAGDYNIIPTDLDVYKPERWTEDALFVSDVRHAFDQLIAQGWVDALRAIYPAEKIYTFWDYFRRAFDRDAGLRIDHFLLNRRAAGRLVQAGVDRGARALPKTSDHAPVWIELEKG